MEYVRFMVGAENVSHQVSSESTLLAFCDLAAHRYERLLSHRPFRGVHVYMQQLYVVHCVLTPFRNRNDMIKCHVVWSQFPPTQSTFVLLLF